MPRANPYKSPKQTTSPIANSELSADQTERLANTRFCIRVVAILAGLTGLYFLMRLGTFAWFLFKYGDVGIAREAPLVQKIQIVWAVVSLFAYAGLCHLYWRYSKRITSVLSGNDPFSSIIPIQNGVWFTSALWLMASAVVYIGIRLFAAI